MHRKVAAALVVALALVVASCGSSEPLTRAELVRRIEVACRAGQAKAQQMTRQRSGSERDQQLRFVTAIGQSQQTVVDELDGLEPPDAAKDDFEAFEQGMKERAELIDEAASSDAESVESAIRSIERRAEAATRRAQEAAQALGIDGCV
jgi:hypothetical protein